MKVKLVDCIHGMIWQSCEYCNTKSLVEVEEEVRVAYEARGGKYDYQEVEEVDDDIEEVEYDIEVGD